MAKMGWTKGSGLGASGDGIVSALHVQVQKRKKKSDAEGGGWADPKGVGRIVGGRRAPGGVDDGGKFGAMSEVIRVENWVDSDLGPEGDGEVMQRIGEECNERFGSVERVFVYHGSKEPLVFVKFTSQLSALRAVNALDGVVFSGQTVRPRFWETEKFESGAWA